MVQLKLPADSRPLAVGLLLLVLLTIYFLGIHWWFVAPQRALAGEMRDLREQHQRFAAIVAEKPEIEKRLAAVRSYESSNQAFLPEMEPAGASANLIQRISDTVKKHDAEGTRCSVQQSTPLRNQIPGEPYQSVSVRVRLTCDTENTAAVLHDLEDGKPFLFLDELMIYQRTGFTRGRQPRQSSRLEVQFTVTGYLRQPVEKT